jgi:hypothetical protein
MKDHEFREQVNDLKELVIKYGHTQQLRAQLSAFLSQFQNQCEKSK